MIHRMTTLAALLVGLVALAACSPAAPGPDQVYPTVYYAPVTPVAYKPPMPPPSGASPTPQPITVLLLGVDRRGASSTTNNTDSIMLFQLDPGAQRIAMLSIPRDLYVNIPGYGQERVNTAYAKGKRDGTGGLALARQTVSAALGIPVQRAVLVDFKAFVTVIDAIGGVDVDVPLAISDPTFPDNGIGYDPFYLSAGRHHLDGATALKYVRTRATPGGDFDRTARQRQIVLAVRNQVVDLDKLPDLIRQSPQLWGSLQGAFESDLTLAEMVDLAVAASRIPADHIQSGSIDDDCTTPWTTPAGAQVLIPRQDKIDALVADLFLLPPATSSAQ